MINVMIPAYTSSLDLFKVCQCVHVIWVALGWSSQVGYHAENEHSWLQSTLCLMVNQVLSQLNFSLLEYHWSMCSTDQLQIASIAAVEARVPDPSAALGLQYLKNSVRGQRHGGDVLTWEKCADWRDCFAYWWSAVAWPSVPLPKPINPTIAFLICGPLFEVLPPSKK